MTGHTCESHQKLKLSSALYHIVLAADVLHSVELNNMVRWLSANGDLLFEREFMVQSHTSH